MIKSHRDLVVWQKSMDLVETVYHIADNLPTKEQFGLILQMKRAAVSVPSNIAEGYGRQTPGNYVQFLSVARGSLLELETQFELCKRLKYLEVKDYEIIQNNILEVSKMLSSLILKIKSHNRN